MSFESKNVSQCKKEKVATQSEKDCNFIYSKLIFLNICHR